MKIRAYLKRNSGGFILKNEGSRLGRNPNLRIGCIVTAFWKNTFCKEHLSKKLSQYITTSNRKFNNQFTGISKFD
jgi:hypothetical protein